MVSSGSISILRTGVRFLRRFLGFTKMGSGVGVRRDFINIITLLTPITKKKEIAKKEQVNNKPKNKDKIISLIKATENIIN